MPSVSVTMAYYNRPELLRNTLWAYSHLHDDLSDVEFIIVDDMSDPALRAAPVAEELDGLLDIRVLDRVHKIGRNPAVPINASVMNAHGEIIVITNPETMPLTPVLDDLRELGTALSRHYVMAPCYSVSEAKQRFISSLDPKCNDFVEQIGASFEFEPRAAAFDGDDGWYEHPTFLPRGLYFCAAMMRDEFVAIGGIDEDFAAGDAWEDTDFLRRLADNGFGMAHIPETLCLHQHHYTSPASRKVGASPQQDNQQLCNTKAQQHVMVANADTEWGVL